MPQPSWRSNGTEEDLPSPTWRSSTLDEPEPPPMMLPATGEIGGDLFDTTDQRASAGMLQVT